MLLRGVGQQHSHDDVVAYCKSHILVGEVVIGLRVRRGDYVHGATAEAETKEPLGRFVKIAGKCQALIEPGVRGP